jgi:hypothetical protein
MNFQFDQRTLPDNLKSTDARDKFVDAVLQLMQSSASGAQRDDALFAAVVGMLVLDGHTDPTAASFEDGFWAVRGESAGSTIASDGKTKVANKAVYQKVASQISKFPGHEGIVFYQELAEVSRKLLENASEIPVDNPGFVSQIRVYDDDYMTNGPQGGDTLDLPDLDQGAAAPDDIQPDNVRAVAVIYVGYQLEQLRLFEVVDRVAETWWNGQLPIGFDRGSKALDDYFWSTEFRLSPPARHMQYSRVLGATGGEVSQEVQPNTQFSDLWIRLVASLAEYDRQQRIGDIVGGQRANALTLTGEGIRQAGRNLAANASLYGWGGTQFAARRLARHVSTSFAILNTPEIQAAYGVDGPYKVIERVATEQWGAAPNIVKYRALAEAGKNILNLIAKYSSIWSGSTGKPLFNDPATTSQSDVAIGTLAESFNALAAAIKGAQNPDVAGVPAAAGGGGGAPSLDGSNPAAATADISDADRDELLRQAGNVIAVQGIKDDTVAQFSQPAEAQYAPSIPTFAPPGAGNGQAGIDQLRQMVSQGQVPSMDQLKNLVMPGAN